VRFLDTEIPGAYVVRGAPVADERGYFMRAFDQTEFENQGLVTEFVQWSLSFTKRRGTLRGMHLQGEPHAEEKLVRCTRGAIHDVIIDLRPKSPTYCRWLALEMDEESPNMLYVPAGLAHGFQVLEDNTEVAYYISEQYHAEFSRGVRWDDPAFAIDWPLPVSVISERDLSYPDFVAG
jgi:dTDP-4-dehydrorhamnose 3,5-epimerase